MCLVFLLFSYNTFRNKIIRNCYIYFTSESLFLFRMVLSGFFLVSFRSSFLYQRCIQITNNKQTRKIQTPMSPLSFRSFIPSAPLATPTVVEVVLVHSFSGALRVPSPSVSVRDLSTLRGTLVVDETSPSLLPS